MSKYLLDSNIFIQSKNLHYRFSFCGNFWNLLREMHAKEMVFTISAVKDELLKINDELSDWVKESPQEMFLDNWEALDIWVGVTEYPRTCGHPYFDYALEEFADEKEADAWLIAYANKFGYTIVTNEVKNPSMKKKVPLYDIAQAFNVPCITLFDFLERHSENFCLI